MEEFPFFSVIVPTYNRREMIAGLLDCLKAQDYPAERFEIILVDDGSTDGTQEMLERRALAGEFRLIRQAHRSPGAARNQGARSALGEALAFTDSDCLPEPGWLSALAEAYAGSGTHTPAAIGGQIENLVGGSWLQRFQSRRGTDHTANHDPSPLYLDTANASFLRKEFLAVGGFSPEYTWSEDVELGFRLRHAGFPLRTTLHAVVWHAGTTSLFAYLGRSYRIGYAKGRLARDFPTAFFPLPPTGWRLTIRNWLEHLIQSNNPPIHRHRLASSMLARLLYRLVQFLTWEKVFWLDTLPNQLHRYRSQQINGLVISFYLCLECICHVAHITGLGSYYLHVSVPRSKAHKP